MVSSRKIRSKLNNIGINKIKLNKKKLNKIDFNKVQLNKNELSIISQNSIIRLNKTKFNRTNLSKIKLKKIRHNRDSKAFLIYLLIFFISIGFAYLTSNLSIFGSSILKGQKWDVHFENVQVSSEGVQIETPEIIDKTTVEYNITLDKPGDFVEFTVDAKNDGSVDAMVSMFDNINIYEGDSETPLVSIPDYLDYSLTYAKHEDIPISQYHLLASGEKVTYKVHVEYKKDITKEQLVTSQQELKATFNVEFLQADKNAILLKKQHKTTQSTLSKSHFRTFGGNNNPKKLVFLDTGVSDSDDEKYADISEEQDNSILAWMDEDTMYVSAKESDLYINAPIDSSGLLGFDNDDDFTAWVKEIEIVDVSKLNTSNVTNMSNMFSSVGYKATTFKLEGLSEWNTSSVISMSYMLKSVGRNATDWSIGDIKGWDVSKVEDMSGMFYGAGEYNATTFKLDLNGWDTSSVTNMSKMFGYAGFYSNSFELNLSGWDTSSVTDMTQMFAIAGQRCKSFKIVGLDNWDTGNVKSMNNTFNSAGQNSTTFDIGNVGNWDTSSVTDMSRMFSNAGPKADYFLDLSGWNVDNVTYYNDFNKDVTSKVTPPNWVS